MSLVTFLQRLFIRKPHMVAVIEVDREQATAAREDAGRQRLEEASCGIAAIAEKIMGRASAAGHVPARRD